LDALVKRLDDHFSLRSAPAKNAYLCGMSTTSDEAIMADARGAN
jgi:hypothetical protein